MATIDVGHGGNYADSLMGTPSALRRPLFPAIRWGAIWAGVAVGLSTQLLLALLGLASGLSAMNLAEGASPTGPLLWAGLSMLISAFIGGYVAARMSGLKRKVDGILHGAVSWAVTTLLFATLATSVAGSLLSGVFNRVAPAMASSTTSGTANGGSSAIGAMLQGQLGANVDPTTMQRLLNDIQAGRRNDAIQLMTSSMGIERSRAETITDQALIIAGNPNQASPQSRAAAEQAVNTAGTAAWMIFLPVALSLASGIAGGMLGARNARRTTWNEPTTTGGGSVDLSSSRPA